MKPDRITPLLSERDKEEFEALIKGIESTNDLQRFYSLSKLKDLLQFNYYENHFLPGESKQLIREEITDLYNELKALFDPLSKSFDLNSALELLRSEEISEEEISESLYSSLLLFTPEQALTIIELIRFKASEEISERRRNAGPFTDPEAEPIDWEPIDWEPVDPSYFGSPFRIKADFDFTLFTIALDFNRDKVNPSPMIPERQGPPEIEIQDRLNWNNKQERLSELIGILVYGRLFTGIEPGSAGIKKVVKAFNHILDTPLNPDSVVSQFSKAFRKELPFTTELQQLIAKARKDTKDNYKEKDRSYKKSLK